MIITPRIGRANIRQDQGLNLRILSIDAEKSHITNSYKLMAQDKIDRLVMHL
jgi:hypothetical protein